MRKQKTISRKPSQMVQNGPKSSHKMVGIVAIIVIALVVALVFLFPALQIGTGQATYTKAGIDTTFKDGGNDKNKKLEFESSYDAAPGDTVVVAVRFSSDVKISGANFGLKYPTDKLTFIDKVTSLPNNDCWKTNTCSAHSSYGSILWPSNENPQWGNFQGSPESGTKRLYEFTLKVKEKTPQTKDGASVGDKLTLSINDGTIAQETTVFGPYEATTVINVVPKCQDADGDGYGKVGTDARACPKRAKDSAVAKVNGGGFGDCQDAKGNTNGVDNKAIHPGAKEACNSVDDNCNADDEKTWDNDPKTGVDKGLKAALDAQLKNVCSSFKVDCQNIFGGELSSCAVGATGGGGTPAGLLPPGNSFYKYTKGDWPTGKDNGQILDGKDIDLTDIIAAARQDGVTFGDADKSPLRQKFKGKSVFVCDDGTYFLSKSTGYVKAKYGQKETPTNYEDKNSKLVDKTTGAEASCPK